MNYGLVGRTLLYGANGLASCMEILKIHLLHNCHLFLPSAMDAGRLSTRFTSLKSSHINITTYSNLFTTALEY